MTWTELRREIFIQAQNWKLPFVQEPSHSVDLSFNYKTQTLDQ